MCLAQCLLVYSRPLVNISWMNKQIVLVLCKGLCEQRVKIMYISVFFPLLVGLAGAVGGWCHLAVAVLHDPLCHHGSLATICKQPEVWGFFLFTLLTIEWPHYQLGVDQWVTLSGPYHVMETILIGSGLRKLGSCLSSPINLSCVFWHAASFHLSEP